MIKLETNRKHTHIHYLLSVEMEELFPPLSKVSTFGVVWVSFPPKGFGAPLRPLTPNSRSSPAAPGHSHQHTRILPASPPDSASPQLPPCFLHSQFPVLHLFVPVQWVICSFTSRQLLLSSSTRLASLMPNVIVPC